MNAIELTKLFVEYAEATKKVEELEIQIKTVVLQHGETQKIAGVTATYYKPGFETPDYATAARNAKVSSSIIEKYSAYTITTKWAEVCKEAGIEVPPGAEKPARVTVKVA
jgi:hypothetical protein